MTTNQTFFSREQSRFRLRSKITVLMVTGAAYSLVVAGTGAATQQPAKLIDDQAIPSLPDRLEQRPRRVPPQAAIKACEGKSEGEPCVFNTARDVREGECLSGTENIFACRPHRRPSSSETIQSTGKDQQAESHTNSQPDPGATPKADNGPGKLLAPASHLQPEAEKILKQSEPDAKQGQAEPPLPKAPTQPTLLDSFLLNSEKMIAFFMVAIFTVCLTWYSFFRYSTLPLRRLRKVTQQLAGGDLTARVGEGLVQHKGEVADLGRDVDRMAERIESLVGSHQRLIRDVSHELRSPLARLNVALELARQSAGPTHSAPFDRIERESDRLNELIAQLLMLTKLESESSMNQMSEFDIALLIKEIAQDVDFEASSNERRVLTTKCDQLLLNGNKELLRQAIENLVRNAARYTAAGTAVEISLQKKESAGRSWAHIEVRDYGPGVPESELYDIFRPFYRVSDSRERQSGGAGVGLAISDRAARLHGGSLRAFNAPGAGLIMEMMLPMR